VVDASHPDARHQMDAVESVLRSISPHLAAEVVVFNKIDRISDPIQVQLLADGHEEADIVHVSARSGEGLERLARVVQSRLDDRATLVELRLPASASRLAARVRSAGGVLEEEFLEDGTLRLTVRLSPAGVGFLQREIPQGATMTVLEEPRARALSEE
jgi:GTP-binding protein HflX